MFNGGIYFVIALVNKINVVTNLIYVTEFYGSNLVLNFFIYLKIKT